MEADAVAALMVTADDRRDVRETLLRLDAWETATSTTASPMAAPLLATETATGNLADAVAQFAVTAEDRREARDVLLERLDSATSSKMAAKVATAVARLIPTAEEQHRARAALLGALAREGHSQRTAEAAEQGLARAALAWADHDQRTRELADAVARLNPTVQDLITWRAWADPPPANLLAAVRRNSEVSAWLEALSSVGPDQTTTENDQRTQQ